MGYAVISDSEISPALRERKYKGRFKASMVPSIKSLALLSLTDAQIAHELHVTRETFARWKTVHEPVRAALEAGRAGADSRVVRSLLQRATGYKHRSTKVFQYEGQAVKVPIIEHYPPDTRAIEFWLTRRRPKEWPADTTTVNVGVQIAGLPDEILTRIQARAREKAIQL